MSRVILTATGWRSFCAGANRHCSTASTAFWCDPKEDMAVVFMSQVLFAPDRVKLRRDIRTLVYSAITESFG